MFGSRLKKLRKQAGLSQKALGGKVFVSQQTIASWEVGATTPSPEMIERIAQALNAQPGDLFGDAPHASAVGGKMVPVLGVVPAGIPIEAIEDILDYEEISPEMAAAGEYFALRIKGSSMEPRIREGDVVIVRQQQDADTGDTAVVMVNGYDATVKRIKKDPDGGLWLLPNNPAFDAQHFSPGEIAGLPVAIIGRVVELRGKM